MTRSLPSTGRAVHGDHEAPADILLIGAEWETRALLRAQLIEEGFEVVATETWWVARRLLLSGSPQLVILDLKGLSDPEAVLNDLKGLMAPDRVLVLGALGSLAPERISRFGFHVLTRPTTIGTIVAAAARLIAR